MRAHGRSRSVLILWAVGGSLACGDEPSPGRPAVPESSALAPKPAEEVPQGGAAAPAAKAAPADPEVEPASRALLTAWLAAQNEGRFDDYAKLYAERFEGVKRVGMRASRFDRKGWLADRARMFGKPMVVRAEDAVVQPTTAGAVVRFVQRYRSGTFQDAGPKQLHLVAGQGGLSIAREEMLASQVTRHDAHELPRADFMPVLHTKSTYVVLAREADSAWGTGEPQLDSDRNGIVEAARMAVNAAAVPVEARGPAPARVRGFAVDGARCEADVGELFLLRRVVPHFGARDELPALAEPAAARAVWDEAAEQTLLVARLDPRVGSCDAALWAHDAGRSAPAVFVREAAGPELLASVERAVRALPAYRAIAREYQAYRAELREPDPSMPERWEQLEAPARQVWAWRGEQRSYASYEVDVGGCGDFEGALWVVFEQRGAALVPVTKPGAEDLPYALELTALFDADGDGALELLGRGFANPEREADVFLRGVRGKHVLVSDLSPPFHDCGC